VYSIFSYALGTMRFGLFLVGSAAVAAAVYVPGKAFDRFITIWLENQVSTPSWPSGSLGETF
jgi:hypothetical protein